jgi:hypothetical protein
MSLARRCDEDLRQYKKRLNDVSREENIGKQKKRVGGQVLQRSYCQRRIFGANTLLQSISTIVESRLAMEIVEGGDQFRATYYRNPVDAMQKFGARRSGKAGITNRYCELMAQYSTMTFEEVQDLRGKDGQPDSRRRSWGLWLMLIWHSLVLLSPNRGKLWMNKR